MKERVPRVLYKSVWNNRISISRYRFYVSVKEVSLRSSYVSTLEQHTKRGLQRKKLLRKAIFSSLKW